MRRLRCGVKRHSASSTPWAAWSPGCRMHPGDPSRPLSNCEARAALALAGALASWCPSKLLYGGGGTFKPMLHGSCPAESGLMAAWYAQQGMTGPLKLLESEIGYYATAARRSFPENVLDRETWY